MQKRNILTAMVAVAALIMVIIVVIIKSNRAADDDATTTVKMETYTSVVEMSDINEDGDVYYYTMVQTYSRPSKQSDYVYPTKKTTTAKATTTGPQYTVITEYVYKYDENGNPIKDENGNNVTEVVTHTELITTTTTTAPATSVVQVTNQDGSPLLDASGKPVTSVAVVETTAKEPETTTKSRFPNVTLPNVELPVSVDDDSGEAILSKINASREEQGLAPLEMTTMLTGEAITRSTQIARNSNVRGVSGKPVSYPSQSSSSAVSSCLNASGSNALNAEYTQVGIGVVKYDGSYYTTIIYK